MQSKCIKKTETNNVWLVKCEKRIDQDHTIMGQRKNLSPRQESNHDHMWQVSHMNSGRSWVWFLSGIFLCPTLMSCWSNSIWIWKQWMKSHFVEMPLPILLLLCWSVHYSHFTTELNYPPSLFTKCVTCYSKKWGFARMHNLSPIQPCSAISHCPAPPHAPLVSPLSLLHVSSTCTHGLAEACCITTCGM